MNNNEKKKSTPLIVAISLGIVFVLIIIACFKLSMELNELQKQKKQLEDELKTVRIEVERLEEEAKIYGTDEYYEKKANEQGLHSADSERIIID